jgi:pimeloyl-ACP methyl ester carboxylesterase
LSTLHGQALAAAPRLKAAVKGSGPTTIVLLHGFGGHSGDWSDIQADLARNARVIAYDLPGHGRSLDASGAGSAPSAAKSIIADLTARGINSVNLAGFSMGGAIAVLVALRAPQLVRSLTLIAPGGFGPQINGPLLERFALADGAEIRKCLNEMSGPGFETLTRDVAGVSALHGAKRQREKLGQIAKMIAKDGRQGEIPREQLATLQAPVALLWGEADPVLPYAQTVGLPDNFQLQTFPGMGHMLLNEARRSVTAAIRRSARPSRA